MSEQQSQMDALRHSAAHMLAAAVLKLYPDTKLGIGPTVENGFYYDFLFPEGVMVGEKELQKIENVMRNISGEGHAFIGKPVSVDEAKQFEKNQPFKLELIEEFSQEGKDLTLYESGPFTDLCRGGHAENTKEIPMGGLKLDRVAGAYWRGDEKKQMLTRIYGYLFPSKAELDAHLTMLEEAKKRDHRKLGRELKLFTISELIGPGLPLMQPRGMIVRKAVEDYLWELHKDLEYSRVWTPHIAKVALYETSGHAAKFGDELFRVQGKEESFIMKPMNCPHHMQIFADNQFSYRDMPVRYFEPATVYRDEKSGQLGGLTRVRAITQDDGHLFCRSVQIAEEVKTIISVIKKFYTTMGMMEGYWVRLSLRGDDTSKYLGSDEVWAMAEKALTDVCESEQLPYKPAKDEAAFYGPKLDFMFKDAIGREWQLATIQCDFNLPERFDLSFVNEKGDRERPVVIHRAISGSLERFMGVMIEHFAGAFPVWMAPVQVAFIPVSEKHQEGAHEMMKRFRKEGVRVDIDMSNETVGKKIRAAATGKIPYIIVVGDKELSGGPLQVRVRGQEEPLVISETDFLTRVVQEAKERAA